MELHPLTRVTGYLIYYPKEESLHVDSCEKLSQEFTGTFIRANSSNLTQEVAEVAEKYHITEIVIPESQYSRWKLLFKDSLTQQLVRLLKNIDLHIIATEKNQCLRINSGNF